MIYTKKIDEMATFYARHFGYSPRKRDDDRIVELAPPEGGTALMLHSAARSQKEGQALVKLVFDVPDVAAFCDAARDKGLEFGPVHDGGGYQFANAKDPSNNSIQVSSRAFSR